MDVVPPELFLERYPPGIRAVAERLRAVVRRAVPDAVERVRPGWHLIGYEAPVPGRRKPAYFAFVAPETEHCHLGFEYGIALRDPDRLLQGAHLKLRQVRFVTFPPGDVPPEASLERLIREAAEVAAMSKEERLGLLLDRTEEEAERSGEARSG